MDEQRWVAEESARVLDAWPLILVANSLFDQTLAALDECDRNSDRLLQDAPFAPPLLVQKVLFSLLRQHTLRKLNHLNEADELEKRVLAMIDEQRWKKEQCLLIRELACPVDIWTDRIKEKLVSLEK